MGQNTNNILSNNKEYYDTHYSTKKTKSTTNPTTLVDIPELTGTGVLTVNHNRRQILESSPKDVQLEKSPRNRRSVVPLASHESEGYTIDRGFSHFHL